MTKRNKFHKSSLYCPDDKDLYDFLKATGASAEKMDSFLRMRGIYSSMAAGSDDLRKFLATLPLGWEDVEKLLDSVDVRESKERLIPKTFSSEATNEQVIQALRDVELIRQKRDRGHYAIVEAPDKRIINVEIDYVATKNEKNRLTQAENATISLVIRRIAGGFSVMHTNSDVAHAIYEVFLGKLGELTKKPEEEKPLVVPSQSISLKAILDTALRVKFFKLMSENIEGFTYGTMIDVKVGRLPKELRPKVSSDDESDRVDEKKDEDAERIRRVILNGTDLHRTKQLAEYFAQGFFITGMAWQSVHDATDELVDFYAGFKNPLDAVGFELCVHGKHLRVDGEFSVERENIPKPTAHLFSALLQDSAIAAAHAIVTEAEAAEEEIKAV
jgi:hypothetical protein